MQAKSIVLVFPFSGRLLQCMLAAALGACLFAAAAPRAQAANLTEVQIQAVLTLLSAFDVDESVILNVESTLRTSSQPPSQPSRAVSKPYCALSTDKSSYLLGEIITFTWTSTNATYAAFSMPPPGKDMLSLPGDKHNQNGSTQVTATVVGNPVVTLEAHNADEMSTCSAKVLITDPAQTSSSAADTGTISKTAQSSSVDLTINDSNGPVSLFINDKVSYKWKSQNVSSCTLVWSGPSSGSASWDTSGTHDSTFTLPGVYTVKLSCIKTTGGVISDSVIVGVTAPAPVVDLKINGKDSKTVVNVGQPVDYTWESKYASSCKLTWSGLHEGSTAWAISGTYTTFYAAVGSYKVTLTCTNAFGTSVSDSVDLLVGSASTSAGEDYAGMLASVVVSPFNLLVGVFTDLFVAFGVY